MVQDKREELIYRGINTANFTLYYDLMPYVGMLSTGIAATAQGPVELPEAIRR